MIGSSYLVVAAGLVSGALSSIGVPSVFHVDDDACPSPGSGTRADPFCSIQAAIDAAASGDVIFVHPGTYAENVDFSGKELKLLSLEGPSRTFIVGVFGDTSPLVRFTQREGPGAQIDGFFIGSPTGVTGSRGISCGPGTSALISNNRIENNHPPFEGAGIACSSASPSIVGNVIRNNRSNASSGEGGGIWCSSASPWIAGNVIEGNSAGAGNGCRGAGIAVLGVAAPLIESNLIVGNHCCELSANFGGGLYVKGGAPLLRGNTFAGNKACASQPGFQDAGFGGAICFESGAVFSAVNTILWGNLAFSGSSIHGLNTGQLDVSYSNLDPDADAVVGPVVLGPGIQRVDPEFVGPLDHHLSATSPMIDAGSLATVPGGTDGDEEPRILDGDLDGQQRVDIGWDEFGVTTLVASGTPTLGGTLTFTTDAPAGWSYWLAFSRRPDDRPLAPFGSILLSPASLRLLGFGTVPGVDSLTIPPIPTLVGRSIHVHALARDPAQYRGSFSRRLSIRVSTESHTEGGFRPRK